MSATSERICAMTFDEVTAFVESRMRADRLPQDRDLMAAFDAEYARVDAGLVADDSGVIPAVLARFPKVRASQLLRAARQVIEEAERQEAFGLLLGRQLAIAEARGGTDPDLMRTFAVDIAELVDSWPAEPWIRSVAS